VKEIYVSNPNSRASHNQLPSKLNFNEEDLFQSQMLPLAELIVWRLWVMLEAESERLAEGMGLPNLKLEKFSHIRGKGAIQG